MFIIYIYIRVDLFSPKRFSLNNILIHSNFVHPDITEIRRVLEELSSYVTLLSGRLVRQLKRRDKNAFKLQRNFDILTAILQAVSLKRREWFLFFFSYNDNVVIICVIGHAKKYDFAVQIVWRVVTMLVWESCFLGPKSPIVHYYFHTILPTGIIWFTGYVWDWEMSSLAELGHLGCVMTNPFGKF